MSSNRQSGIFNNDDDDGFGFEEALKIVGMVMVLVILLLCLRFGCNIAIDLCVLCNPYEARRTVIDLRDRLFPFFKRRLVNPGDDVEQAEGGDRQQEQQESARTPSRPEEPTVESLLRGLSAEERQQVIDTVFQGKLVKKRDLAQWRDPKFNAEDVEAQHHSDCSSDDSRGDIWSVGSISADEHGISCSICLHDLAVGDTVFVSPPCQHVYHRSCIVEWCSTNNTLCPYCRTQMMTEAQVQDASSPSQSPVIECDETQ